MPGTHAVYGSDASVGATAGTFDDINTVGDPQILVDDASTYLGFMFSGSPVATTAGEAQSGRVRLTSKSLDLVGEIFTYGAASGAGIATNDQSVYMPVDYVPMEITAKGAERITSAFTTYTPDPTDAWSVVVSQLHEDGTKFPREFWPYWAAGKAPPCKGGDTNYSTVSAVTRTSLGVTTIAAKFKEILGIQPSQVQDPVGTAGEEAVGVLELTSGISGIAPNFFPMPSITPDLGTPVGQPIAHKPIRWLPFYLKRTESVDRTLEGFLILSTAITAANGFSYGLAFR
jgi:hypothetical protein